MLLNPMLRLRAALAASLLVLPLLAAPDVIVKIAPDHPKGVYDPGETAVWTLRATVDDQPAEGTAAWLIRRGGLTETASGTTAVANGTATFTGMLEQPGTLLLEVRFTPVGADQATRALGGAVFAPENIRPSAPEPEDFDDFWSRAKAELEAVPMNAVLEPGEAEADGVDYARITMDNIRGTHIYGHIAKPTGGTNLPAMLQVQYAGVYPLRKPWVTRSAANGWLVMNISAHDIPIDLPEERYAELNETTLKGYPHIGNTSRDTSYFLRMYLACRRAVEYITGRDDWNGEVLVVHGGSQGGLQAVVTAALHPAVTAIAANVPAGCDHTGDLVGRAPGWPKWVRGAPEDRREAARLAATYYDVVNVARRVQCPALVGVGLIDTTCPPAGVIAMFNQLAGPKRLEIMPTTGHGGKGADFSPFYRAFGAWTGALHDGKPPPLE